MFKLITTILFTPSLLKPDVSISHTRQIYTLMQSVVSPDNSQAIQKIKNSRIWIFDKDDTLVCLDQFKVTDQHIKKMLYHLISTKDNQIKRQIYIVSNSVINHKQTKTQLQRTHVSFQYENKQVCIQILPLKNKKPNNGEEIMEYITEKNKFGISTNNKEYTEIRKIKNQDVTIIGDRLLTDIYLGKKMGWNTIFVNPIEQTTVSKHGLGVKAMRIIQNIIKYIF